MENDPYEAFKNSPARLQEPARRRLLDSTQVGAIIFVTLCSFAGLFVYGLYYLMMEGNRHGGSYTPAAPANATAPAQNNPPSAPNP